MKDNKSFIKILSSSILFVFLLVIKGYLFYILNLDLSKLNSNINLILDIVYAVMSLLITLIFYSKIPII